MSIRIDGTNTTANPGITGGDADTGLQFGTDEVSIVTGGTERLFINSSGNVGVGTTNPGKALSVKGSSYGQAEIVGPTGSELYFVDSEGGSSNGTISYNHSSDYMNFYTAGSERMRITSTGQMRLAGAGITFNGDTATANELDDYEEGSWTPTLLFGGSSIIVDTGNTFYVKVGKMVVCQFEIYGLASPNGNTLTLGGFPFTPLNEGTFPIMSNNVTFPSSRTMLTGYYGPTQWQIYASGSNVTWRGLVGTDMGTGSFLGTISYRAS